MGEIICGRCNPPKDFGGGKTAYIMWAVHMSVVHRNHGPAIAERKKNQKAVNDAMKAAGKKKKKKGSGW